MISKKDRKYTNISKLERKTEELKRRNVVEIGDIYELVALVRVIKKELRDNI